MIGVCTHCKHTDELVAKVLPGGFTIDVCEWCAEEDRREHDDLDAPADDDGNDGDTDADSDNGVA